jgi:hypothetical protein
MFNMGARCYIGHTVMANDIVRASQTGHMLTAEFACFRVILTATVYAWSTSGSLERRYQTPKHPIPSRYWNSKLNIPIKEDE